MLNETGGTPSMQQVSCFEQRSAALSQSSSFITGANASDIALGEIRAIRLLFANAYKTFTNATALGDYIGSTFVARDMIQQAATGKRAPPTRRFRCKWKLFYE